MWFGAIRVDSGGMPIGNLTAFLQYLMQILLAVLMAVFMFVLVPRAAVSAGRIQEVLQTELVRPRSRASGRAGAVPSSPALVEFRNVEFGYPGAEHRSCTTSRSRRSRARRPRSSAAPAAARSRWSTSSRASTT